MDRRDVHKQIVEHLQRQVHRMYCDRSLRKSGAPLSLQYSSAACNTTRPKAYKDRSSSVDFGALHSIVHMDYERRAILVEPRVTMEELLDATLPLGLAVPIIPEFKGISVGGAIMGGATESSAFRYGLFNDVCLSFDILLGDGTVVHASPAENSEIFYSVPGSYGSLGALVLAEIRLVPVPECVLLQYHLESDPAEAIRRMRKLCHSSDSPDFLDGIVFSNECAVVIEGWFCSKNSSFSNPLTFSVRPLGGEWFYQHVEKAARSAHAKEWSELMGFEDYAFRYDKGAFWMGAYLCRASLLARFVWEGLLKGPSLFKEDLKDEFERFHTLKSPNALLRMLFHPWMGSRKLWKLFHTAEGFINRRTIIQDFCIPEMHAESFLGYVCDRVGTFPLWLCPIRGTSSPQIFAPHLLQANSSFSHFMNVGVYGLPAKCASVEAATRDLEQRTKVLGGRKVLYSCSYYSQDEFWQIYSRSAYETMREKTHACNMWHDITEKVLSTQCALQ
jgi:Delta24-sterol reductase